MEIMGKVAQPPHVPWPSTRESLLRQVRVEVDVLLDRLEGQPGFAELAAAHDLAVTTGTHLTSGTPARARVVAMVAFQVDVLADRSRDPAAPLARRARLAALELARLCAGLLAGEPADGRAAAVRLQCAHLETLLERGDVTVYGGAVPA